MSRFQLVLSDRHRGPIRESWDEAAQDAVSAGVALWVWDHFPNSRAIEWTGATRGSIKTVADPVLKGASTMTKEATAGSPLHRACKCDRDRLSSPE
jgi:hypothetical protein